MFSTYKLWKEGDVLVDVKGLTRCDEGHWLNVMNRPVYLKDIDPDL